MLERALAAGTLGWSGLTLVGAVGRLFRGRYGRALDWRGWEPYANLLAVVGLALAFTGAVWLLVALIRAPRWRVHALACLAAAHLLLLVPQFRHNPFRSTGALRTFLDSAWAPAVGVLLAGLCGGLGWYAARPPRQAGDTVPPRLDPSAMGALVLAVLPTFVSQLVAWPLARRARRRVQAQPAEWRGERLASAAMFVAVVLLLPSLLLAWTEVEYRRWGNIGTNERAAIGTLRSITTAQEQWKRMGGVDQDGSGTGEYGFIRELSGQRPDRNGRSHTASPFIANFAPRGNGVFERNGYYFVMYLPTAQGVAMAEPDGELNRNAADAPHQELRWACYAWPKRAGGSGNRMFFTSSAGNVYAGDDGRGPRGAKSAAPGSKHAFLTEGSYAPVASGLKEIPSPESAYDTESENAKNLEGGIGLAVATLKSHDGRLWVPAGS